MESTLLESLAGFLGALLPLSVGLAGLFMGHAFGKKHLNWVLELLDD